MSRGPLCLRRSPEGESRVCDPLGGPLWRSSAERAVYGGGVVERGVGSEVGTIEGRQHRSWGVKRSAKGAEQRGNETRRCRSA